MKMSRAFLTGLTVTLAALSPAHGNADPLADSKNQLQHAHFSSAAEKAAFGSFITGREFCAKFASITSIENGFYVSVPVDYSKPNGPKTEIWAYLQNGPFDAKKPTVIYFDGGPGGNSHGQLPLVEGFNEVHYDQRGVACSHPAKLALYRDPAFYSDMNNVRDADEIRKHLGVPQISLFGASYGTVLATLYASSFPSAVKAVVLDGVELDGKSMLDLSSTAFRARQMYKELPVPTQNAMLSYFSTFELAWNLTSLLRAATYSNDSYVRLAAKLESLFPSPDRIDVNGADKIFKTDTFTGVVFSDDIGAVEPLDNSLLTCKNVSHEVSSLMPIFGKFGGSTYIFDLAQISTGFDKQCPLLKTKADVHPYLATRYHFSAPVTYFEGNWDGATLAANAMKHYKAVPHGRKQLLIALLGGHCAAEIQAQDKAHPQQQAAMRRVLSAALAGDKITPDLLKSINEGNEQVRWVYTNHK